MIGKPYVCPKCRAAMRQVGHKILGELVIVERCGMCASVLLDNGELEKLIELDRRLVAMRSKTPLAIKP